MNRLVAAALLVAAIIHLLPAAGMLGPERLQALEAVALQRLSQGRLRPAELLEQLRLGRPVPIHTGEAYDGGGTAMVPPVRIEEFYMTSPSPATE